MSLEENIRIANRYHQEVIQNLSFDVADEIFAPDCVFHGPNRDARFSVRGPAQAKRIACTDADYYMNGFKFIHEPVIAEGNLIAFIWRVEGQTRTGIPLSGGGVDIIRMENGKVAEVWFASAPPFAQLLALIGMGTSPLLQGWTW